MNRYLRTGGASCGIRFAPTCSTSGGIGVAKCSKNFRKHHKSGTYGNLIGHHHAVLSAAARKTGLSLRTIQRREKNNIPLDRPISKKGLIVSNNLRKHRTTQLTECARIIAELDARKAAIRARQEEEE
jgi:monoamine oxidase